MAVSAAPGFELVLDYDVAAKGCGTLGMASVTQNGRRLEPLDKGGEKGGDCARPKWATQAEPETPFINFRFDDGVRLQAAFRRLFAPRSVALRSLPQARPLEWVELELHPETDRVPHTDLELRFIPEGAAELDAIVWYGELSGTAEFERNIVRVLLPPRQRPGPGKLRVRVRPQADVFACEGFDDCRVEGLASSLETPFTVLP